MKMENDSSALHESVEDKRKLLSLLCYVSERSFRRGYQHGYLARGGDIGCHTPSKMEVYHWRYSSMRTAKKPPHEKGPFPHMLTRLVDRVRCEVVDNDMREALEMLDVGYVHGTIQTTDGKPATTTPSTRRCPVGRWLEQLRSMDAKSLDASMQHPIDINTPDNEEGAKMANADVRAEVVMVTPQIATHWLSTNSHNRTLRKAHVQYLARQMKNGDWCLNGETIILSDGHLIDGQHRLRAVVESGAEVEMLVVHNAPRTAFDTIDGGLSRTCGDALNEVGARFPDSTAAALRWIQKYFSGKMSYNTYRMSQREAIDLYMSRRDIDRSAHMFNKAHVRVLSPAQAIALHYLFSKKDQDLADWFMNKLESGEELSNEEPVYRLRERLLHDKTLRVQMLPYMRMALSVIAWNAHRENRKLRIMKWASMDDPSGNFPVII